MNQSFPLRKEFNTGVVSTNEFDEISEMESVMYENLDQDTQVPKDVYKSFKIRKNLNSHFWKNDEMTPFVRKRLIKIAMDFVKDLELPKGTKLKDIVFTGSLANYNWSKFSDVDIHVVLDFDQLEGDSDVIKNYFQTKKNLWNEKHDITIFSYPVEMYVQDVKEELHATAIYSILYGKWLQKPSRETFSIDKEYIKSKLNSLMGFLRKIKDNYNNKNYTKAIELSKKLKEKIKNIRKSGLETGGEFSMENILFKILRRTDFIEQLDLYKSNAYDKMMSINESKNEKPMKNIIKRMLHEMFIGGKKDREEIDLGKSAADAAEEKEAKKWVWAQKKTSPAYAKAKIEKAEAENKSFEAQNPDDFYFSNPNEGTGFFQVAFYAHGLIQAKHTRQPETQIGTCRDFQSHVKYCFVKAGSRFLEDGTRIPQKMVDAMNNPIKSPVGDPLDTKSAQKPTSYLQDLDVFNPRKTVSNPISPDEAKDVIFELLKKAEMKEPIDKELAEKAQRIQVEQSYGASPAADAATKALLNYKDTILSFYGASTYVTPDAKEYSKEKMTGKERLAIRAQIKLWYGRSTPNMEDAFEEFAEKNEREPKDKNEFDTFYKEYRNILTQISGWLNKTTGAGKEEYMIYKMYEFEYGKAPNKKTFKQFYRKLIFQKVLRRWLGREPKTSEINAYIEYLNKYGRSPKDAQEFQDYYKERTSFKKKS